MKESAMLEVSYLFLNLLSKKRLRVGLSPKNKYAMIHAAARYAVNLFPRHS